MDNPFGPRHVTYVIGTILTFGSRSDLDCLQNLVAPARSPYIELRSLSRTARNDGGKRAPSRNSAVFLANVGSARSGTAIP
jgi:hypothetical protein